MKFSSDNMKPPFALALALLSSAPDVYAWGTVSILNIIEPGPMFRHYFYLFVKMISP